MGRKHGSDITRRDFLNGVAVGVAGAAFADFPLAGAVRQPAGVANAPVDASSQSLPVYYPPRLQGMRGSNDGSFKVAHALAFGDQDDWGDARHPDAEPYDLVIVGAGLSGLAATHFYRKRRPGARVLLLDAHDDFGGHARRVEFDVDGRLLVCTGGSFNVIDYGISEQVMELFADFGIDMDALEAAYDGGFYERHGLGYVTYFDKATYGEDHVARGTLGGSAMGATRETLTAEQIGGLPLPAEAKGQLVRLLSLNEDRTAASVFGEFEFLSRITYQQLLVEHLGVTDPTLLQMLRKVPATTGLWGDSVTALDALLDGAPGLGGTSLSFLRWGWVKKLISRYAYGPTRRFPDGNASIVRLMVRRLVPGVSPPSSDMADVVTAPFDYGGLDRPGSEVRIRLNSTVVRAAHEGDDGVSVTYVRDGVAERVAAKHCVLACWNNVIPHLCPDLPEQQASALRSIIKVPIIGTSVALRDWRPLKNAGIAGGFCPGSFHTHFGIDWPTNLGGYRFPESPDEPIVLILSHTPEATGDPNPRARGKEGRRRLLGTPFETFEQEVRRHLTGMLGPYGFDADRDIAGITVSRWAHGYTFPASPAFEPHYEEGQYPHEVGRKTFGRIGIANNDAGALPLLQPSVDQAWRAVDELLS